MRGMVKFVQSCPAITFLYNTRSCSLEFRSCRLLLRYLRFNQDRSIADSKMLCPFSKRRASHSYVKVTVVLIVPFLTNISISIP